MTRRSALCLLALGIVSGTAVGVIKALAVLHAWGWSGPALALRVLGRHSAQALFIGLAAAAGLGALGWLAHRVYTRWLRGRSFLPGRTVAHALWLWTGVSRIGNDRRLLGLTLAATLLVAVLQVGAVAWEPSVGTSRPNVLLIVVDCLRRDHLGVYGYERPTSPAIDRFAAQARVFERAYSTASWTKPAVASLITGRFPDRHRTLRQADRLAKSSVTLAERLAGVGYHTLFLGGNAWISGHFQFDQGYDSFAIMSELTGEEVRSELLNQLSMVRGRPFFAYVHFMDVHLPYGFNRYNDTFVPAGTATPVISSGAMSSAWGRRRTAAGLMSEQDRARIVGLYDGQIRFVDDQIGIILGQLEHWGVLENTLVILTADHGEEFWEHGNFEHGHSVYDEVLRVPLIVRGPGFRAGRVDAPVSLADIAPSIVSLSGASAENDAFDGMPLQKRTQVGDDPLLAVSTLYGREKYAALDETRKAILNVPAASGGWGLVGVQAQAGQQLFDLTHDVSEERSTAPAEPIPPAWLDILKDVRVAGELRSADRVLSEDEIFEQLEALGYME